MPVEYQIVPTDEVLAENDAPEIARSAPSFDKDPNLTAVVKGRRRDSKPWSETAVITSLSSSGTGFFLSRECLVGNLVSLMLPMPQRLRRYDDDKRLYRIWGLVQYCYEAGGDEEPGYHVGVALIGKNAPEAYSANPLKSFRVVGMDRHGLWKIEEMETSFKQRASVRYWNSIDVNLYRLNEKQEPTASERTVTENVSEDGAAVFSDLRVSVGDRIMFQSRSPQFSSLSIVRHRKIGLDDRRRIHLEFIENKFPVLELDAPIEDDDSD